MIIDKILEVLEMLIDCVCEALKILLELNFNCIKLIIFNSLCRGIAIGFVCLWLIIIIIANKEDIKEYISIYLTDIRIYKEELKHYDDITFKMFGRNEDGYTLKDFLPVTKERINHFKAVKEWEQINID